MPPVSKIIWSLATFRAVLYSLIVTGTSYKAAVAVTPWSVMNHDQHIELFIGLWIIQAGVMLSFLDSTIAALVSAKGQPVLPPPPEVIK